MGNSEISVRRTYAGKFEVKEVVVMGLLKSIKVDKSPGSSGVQPRLWRRD